MSPWLYFAGGVMLGIVVAVLWYALGTMAAQIDDDDPPRFVP